MKIKKALALCGFVLCASAVSAAEVVTGAVLEDDSTFLTFQKHPSGVVVRVEQWEGIPLVAVVAYTSGANAGRVFQIKFSTDDKGTFTRKLDELVDGRLVPVTLAQVRELIRVDKGHEVLK